MSVLRLGQKTRTAEGAVVTVGFPPNAKQRMPKRAVGRGSYVLHVPIP